MSRQHVEDGSRRWSLTRGEVQAWRGDKGLSFMARNLSRELTLERNPTEFLLP